MDGSCRRRAVWTSPVSAAGCKLVWREETFAGAAPMGSDGVGRRVAGDSICVGAGWACLGKTVAGTVGDFARREAGVGQVNQAPSYPSHANYRRSTSKAADKSVRPTRSKSKSRGRGARATRTRRLLY